MTSAMLRYTLLRLVLFVVVLVLLAAAGARGLLLAALAIGVSMALSYVLLRGPRDAVARELVERHERRLAASGERPSSRLDVDAAAEDAEDDARRAREKARDENQPN